MVFKGLREQIDAFLARDPAARSGVEIFLCYPGLHAVMVHRVTHRLWNRGLRLLARMIAQAARTITGIEIHPGARIGRRLVIDHGLGVVIGETAEIGDDVTLYQGVTLGGVSPSVDSAKQVNVKRHPTIHDGVIVGSGAQVLGPIIVGEGARVGANSVVTRDVPPHVTAVGIPAHVVLPRDRAAASEFRAYGTTADGCPDPVLACIEVLRGQVVTLMERIEVLEARLATAESVDDATSGDGIDGKGMENPQIFIAADRGRQN